MAKKERLGSDPFKGGSLDWIQDTREEKKKNDKEVDVKTSKRLNAKASKSQDTKKLVTRKRHTIYLSAAQSKKLRVYAAANDMQLSEVVEILINNNL